MKGHLAILLWAASPDQMQLCATPFFHAAAAAAMDVDVEMHFSAKSVLLLVPGVASALYAGVDRSASIYQHMQQAATFGARFYACSDAIAAHAVDRSRLVPEVTGFAGASAFIARALDAEWSTLVF
jgi:uncharacterized protein